MFNEVFFRAIMDKLRPGWRERGEIRRRNPWNAVAMLLSWGFGAGICYCALKLVWKLHLYFHPAHAGHWRDIPKTHQHLLPALAMTLPIGLASLVLGMIAANLVLWCVPPARRSFEREARVDPELGFVRAMAGLLWFGLFICIFAALAALYGAWSLTDLT
jgi:hypothetical protein